MKQPVFLRVYSNGKLEQVKQFTDSQIVIGRNSDLQMPLDGEGVSPIHAVIDERDSGYYISDLGSKSGTYKNGQKIFDEPLQSGDELQFGPYKIEFFVGVPKPTRAPQQPVSVTPLEKPDMPPPSKVVAEPPPPAVVEPPPVVKKAEPVAEVPRKGGANAPIQKKPEPTASSTQMTNALTERLRPSRGTVVEIVVAWGDRVIATHHFSDKCEVTIGSDESNTIVVPLLGVASPKHTLLKIETSARVCITNEMTGEYFKGEEHISFADFKRRNRMFAVENGYEFDLVQDEMVRIHLHSGLLSIYVRFVSETPAPIMAPVLDMTASESTAVLLSFVIAAIFGLYMMIYSPKPPEEEKIEEPLRKATITFNAPKKRIVEVAKVEEVPQQKKIVKVEMNKERSTTKPNPGRAAELRPSPKNKKTSVVSSTIKQGGTVKTGKPAANAQSETRDVSKMGLLSTFGGKGAQSQLTKAYSGTGELLGDAAKATGYTGSNEDRAGESLGGRLKNVGAGGKGSATYGIGGVGTQGKGTGTFGAGTGGIGKRGRVDLNIGESEAEFTGSIDREAIRRVIRENKKLFENCYNQALRKNSDAYGKVEVKWHIVERGRATNSVVKTNTVGDKAMGDCVARVIRGLTFPEPPPDQIAEVTYPFVFASQ